MIVIQIDVIFVPGTNKEYYKVDLKPFFSDV